LKYHDRIFREFFLGSESQFSEREVSLIKYLAYICIKYNVDPEEVLEGIQLAMSEEEVEVGDITIWRRSINRGESTLLITKNSEVVTQFKMPQKLLDRKALILNVLKEAKALVKRERPAKCIGDLKAGMRKVEVTGEILSIGKPRTVMTRLGYPHSIAEAVVGDGTGKIILPLWNERINEFSVGDRIKVTGAKVIIFRGSLQLQVGKGSQLTRLEK